MPEDPYVYPGTDCLRNRLGIRDADELGVLEGERTSAVLARLERNPLPGPYNLEHLRAFHRRIFGDIYEWAGEFRTVSVTKEQSMFALPVHIEPYLDRVLADLAAERLLRGLPRQGFVDRLTHYYAELNAVHPFAKATAGRSGPSSVSSRTKPATTSPGSGSAASATTAPRPPVSAATTALLQAMLDDLVEPLSPSQD